MPNAPAYQSSLLIFSSIPSLLSSLLNYSSFRLPGSVPLLRCQFVEDDTVRPVHRDFLAVHDDRLLLKINIEERHRVGLVIQRDQMPVVGEQGAVLRIVAGDRKAQNPLERSVLLIDLKNRHRIVPCIGRDDVVVVPGQVQRGSRGIGAVIVVERRDRLYLLEIRLIVDDLIGIDIDRVLQLVDDSSGRTCIR